MNETTGFLQEFVASPLARAGIIFVVALLAALFVRLILFRLIRRLTLKSRSSVDDELLQALRGPIVLSLVVGGLAWAIAYLQLSGSLSFVFLAVIKTLVVLTWGRAAMRIGSVFLEAMSRNHERLPWVQPQTLPPLQLTWKILIIGGAFYFLLISWRINPASWIASAGVAGLAIGFAAKDTLSNLFAGVFIVADAPYRVGDFVNLEGGLRGEITEIGLRSSRILTRDDIEVTVPNALIANGTIINESGGRHAKMRVRVKVSAAYGSDLDRVREVLLAAAEDVAHVVSDPEPRVRFRAFGDSGLLLELLVWIEEPVFRGRVLDQLNERVYKGFNAAGIEIPYAKQDVYVRQLPPTASRGASAGPPAG